MTEEKTLVERLRHTRRCPDCGWQGDLQHSSDKPQFSACNLCDLRLEAADRIEELEEMLKMASAELYLAEDALRHLPYVAENKRKVADRAQRLLKAEDS